MESVPTCKSGLSGQVVGYHKRSCVYDKIDKQVSVASSEYLLLVVGFETGRAPLPVSVVVRDE